MIHLRSYGAKSSCAGRCFGNKPQISPLFAEIRQRVPDRMKSLSGSLSTPERRTLFAGLRAGFFSPVGERTRRKLVRNRDVSAAIPPSPSLHSSHSLRSCASTSRRSSPGPSIFSLHAIPPRMVLEKADVRVGLFLLCPDGSLPSGQLPNFSGVIRVSYAQTCSQ